VRIRAPRVPSILSTVSLAALLLLTACADLGLPIPEPQAPSDEPSALTLTKIEFDDLESWDGENFVERDDLAPAEPVDTLEDRMARIEALLTQLTNG